MSVGGGGHNIGWLMNGPNQMLLLPHTTAETEGWRAKEREV